MSVSTHTQAGVSIYESLAERLRVAIRRGDYQPGQLLGSEHELARQENISRMTVRHAVEMLVHEGLLERRPGKGLYVCSDYATKTLVQVVAGNLHWEPSLQVSRGVQSVARQKGIQIQLYDAHGEVELDLKMLRQLPQSSARGAIIISVHAPAFTEVLYHLKSQGFPFVLVDQRLHDIEVPSVLADNLGGGCLAGQTLLKLGHRRIGFIGNLSATTVRDRLTGLRDALADAAMPFDRSLILDVPTGSDFLGDWSEQVAALTRQLMSRPDRPTALFCSCDAIARAAYRELLALGVRIPDDLSVIGFDDDPLAEWLTPPLTTLRQPFHNIGQSAMELLCQRMDNPTAPIEHRVLPVELISRASLATACTA